MLERLGDRLPAVLDELGGVAGVDALADHLVEAEQRAGLEHAAEDGLLTHQVALHLGHEGGLEHAGAVAAGAAGIGLGDVPAFALRVVLAVHGDQGGHAEAAFVLLAHLGAGRLGRDHDHGQVLADLHALLDDVEAVRVGQASAFFHERHDRGHHLGVLLVRGEVDHQVGGGDRLFVIAHGEAVFGGVLPALPLFANGRVTQGVAHVQAGIAQVEALVQALGAAADDDDFFAFQLGDAVGKLVLVHEPALAQFLELQAQRQRVEIVLSHGGVLSVSDENRRRDAGRRLCAGGPGQETGSGGAWSMRPHHTRFFCCEK